MKRARPWPGGRQTGAESPFPPLPVRIVEDHHHAARHIHGGIRRHRLLPSGLTVLHFDSHPDLVVPPISEAVARDAEALYDALDERADGIASWIMPLAFRDEIRRLTWVHGPWCGQIADGDYSVHVGPSAVGDEPGVLVADTPLPYFARGQCVGRLHGASAAGFARTLVALAEAVRLVDSVATEGFVLDICLDFFAVADPLAGEVDALVGPERRRCVAALFDAALHHRPRCLPEFLRVLGVALGDGAPAVSGPRLREELAAYVPPETGFSDWGPFADAAGALGPDKLLFFGPDLGQPSHEPSVAELDGLFATLERTIALWPRPGLVTVARSAEDGYTPAHSAPALEKRVLDVLRRAYGHLAVARDDPNVDAAHPSLWPRAAAAE